MRLIFLLFIVSVLPAVSDANTLDGVYQVRVIDKQTNEKSSIGSGFAVSEGGLLVTNYHVISSVANYSDAYFLEVIDSQGRYFPAELINLDIVNDLALLKFESDVAYVFTLGTEEPSQGDEVLALGNPLDLGVMIVPGTWNGAVAHRYHRLINFSGALNPGMSGGPAVNDSNEVVGVNVAGYGNNLSLLVPLEFVASLIERGATEVGIEAEMSAQLYADQSARVEALLEGNWDIDEFADTRSLSEITDFFTCWGASNSDEVERKINIASRSCGTDESIYLQSDLRTGDIRINTIVYENASMSDMQFIFNVHRNLSLNGRMQQNENHFGRFECEERFLEGTVVVNKGVMCVRAYKHYDGLFDVYLKISTPPEDGRIAQGSLVMTGVSELSAKRLANRFLEALL